MEINLLQFVSIEQIHKALWDQEFYATLKYMTQANKIVHGNKNGAGIGHTTKMNCYSWGIPTRYCKVGSQLVSDPEAPCYTCYANRGNFLYDDVQACLQKRYEKLNEPHWIEAMAFLINTRNKEKGQFRWFDSGDLQGHDHLIKIIQVCKHTPQVRHWLPTQEHDLIEEHVLGEFEIPKNLTIRLSARKKNQPGPTALAKYLNSFKNVVGFIGTSNVGDKKLWLTSKDKCPSSLHDNNCGSCSKCWGSVGNVMYKKH